MLDVNGIRVDKERVWSTRWQVRPLGKPGSFTAKFKAEQYIYTDDGLISRLNYNDVVPIQFVVVSNDHGLENTGDLAEDRKSKTGIGNYGAGTINLDVDRLTAQYKLFFNEPDINEFPVADLSRLFGDLNRPIFMSGCPENYCINIDVNKAASVELLLDLNGIDGYQLNSKDTLIEAELINGLNCLVWDGKDREGNVVNEANIQLEISFVAGVTHMPFYDVESNPSGLDISFVHPAAIAGPTEVYWDDRDIAGNTEFQGCVSNCHAWVGTSSSGIGNNNLINSWWLVKKDPIKSSVVIKPLALEIGEDKLICEG